MAFYVKAVFEANWNSVKWTFKGIVCGVVVVTVFGESKRRFEKLVGKTVVFQVAIDCGLAKGGNDLKRRIFF